MKLHSTDSTDPNDGFLDLARLVWSTHISPLPTPLKNGVNESDVTAEALIHWLATLLRHANNGRGGIRLGRKLTPELESAFQQHPELFHLENTTLQLPRYARYRDIIRSFFSSRHTNSDRPFSAEKVAIALNSIFPAQQLYGRDSSSIVFDNAQQRLAIANLLDARVGVLTGGPGTGKTTTAAAILALRKRLDPTLEAESILVAAPTGKSACRIAEAISKATAHLHGLTQDETAFLQSIRARTLHKALEWSPIPPERGGPFRRNSSRPIDASLVLVDEASMVDLALMHALIAALPANGSLLLLGDSDQLESVEVGGMLTELVQRSSHPHLPLDLQQTLASRLLCPPEKVISDFTSGLPECPNSSLEPLPGLVIGLKYSRRAMNAPWILDLAALCRPDSLSSVATISALFQKQPQDNLAWHREKPTRHRRDLCKTQWEAWARATLRWTGLTPEHSSEALNEPLQALLQFQLLCSSNTQVDNANAEGLSLLNAHANASQSTSLPHGCPIIIETNDHVLELSNGDVGVIIGPAPHQPGTLALFASNTPIPRLIPIAQLPAHRPAFALTIHKSQGSEWAHVAIELPSEAGSALLSRNLLYTAITRSSQRIDLFGSESALEELFEKGVHTLGD